MSFKLTGIAVALCSTLLLFVYYVRSTQITSNRSIHSMEISNSIQNFQVDLSADKYKNMEKAVSKNDQLKTIKTLSENTEPIQKDIDLITKSYSIKIDGKKNMIVFAIGNHDEYDFEYPMLALSSLSPIVYKITTKKKENASYKQLLVNDIHSIFQVAEVIETAIQDDGIRIDTVFMDLQDNEWDLMKELVPRFCLMIRQFIIRTSPSLLPAFRNVRDMKDFYRQHGYTYSRIGNIPTIRIFMKE